MRRRKVLMMLWMPQLSFFPPFRWCHDGKNLNFREISSCTEEYLNLLPLDFNFEANRMHVKDAEDYQSNYVGDYYRMRRKQGGRLNNKG